MPNEGLWDGKFVRKVAVSKGVEVAAVAVVIVDSGGLRCYEKLSELEDSVVGGEDVCEDVHFSIDGACGFEDFAGHEFTVRFPSHKVDLSIATFPKESQKLLFIFFILRKVHPGSSFGLQIAMKSDRPDFLDGLLQFWILSDFFIQLIAYRPHPA